MHKGRQCVMVCVGLRSGKPNVASITRLKVLQAEGFGSGKRCARLTTHVDSITCPSEHQVPIHEPVGLASGWRVRQRQTALTAGTDGVRSWTRSLSASIRQLAMAAKRDQQLNSLLESGDIDGLRAALDEVRERSAAKTVSLASHEKRLPRRCESPRRRARQC